MHYINENRKARLRFSLSQHQDCFLENDVVTFDSEIYTSHKIAFSSCWKRLSPPRPERESLINHDLDPFAGPSEGDQCRSRIRFQEKEAILGSLRRCKRYRPSRQIIRVRDERNEINPEDHRPFSGFAPATVS